MFFFVRKLCTIAFLDAFPLYEGGDFNPEEEEEDGMMRFRLLEKTKFQKVSRGKFEVKNGRRKLDGRFCFATVFGC